MSDEKKKADVAANIIAGLIIFCGVALIVGVLASPFVGWSWYQSCRQARVYNEQYNTHYSCGDFFWAQDQINTQTQTIKLK